MVYINPQCLKNSLTGLLNCILFLLFRKKIQSFLNYLTKLRGCVYTVSLADLIRNSLCDLLAVRFI